MIIFGLDFTSSPSPRKPITCAKGILRKNRSLVIKDISTFDDFSKFEAFLNSKGPWIAGFDFPFGMPAEFIYELKIKSNWELYVYMISKWKIKQFENKVKSFKKSRTIGRKEPNRMTDFLARAKSPLKQVNPPLIKMFFQGAPRLLKSSISIIPCRTTNDNRMALETYPAQLARIFAGSYKNEGNKGNLSNFKKAREKIINGITSANMTKKLGLRVQINKNFKLLAIRDGKGDILDAILCTVQAAWFWEKRETKCELFPHKIDKIIALEGWIAGYDPQIPNPFYLKSFRTTVK